MRRYEYNPQTTNGWRTYPIRLTVPGKSRCCGRTKVLVQSMEGGFVTANCTKCGKQDAVSLSEFENLGVWVSCPECNQRMAPQKVVYSSYGFACEKCDLYIRLGDLLPKWDDIF